MNIHKFEKQLKISILDHCYEDCSLCSGLGCVSFKNRDVDFVQEKIDLALKLQYQSIVFPVNAFFHENIFQFVEKVQGAGLKPVVTVLLRKFNNQTLSFARKILNSGGAIELIIDQPVSKLAWVYIQPLINVKNDLRFTLILLKSVNHWNLVKDIPEEVASQLEIHSPLSKNDNLYLSNDLLFKVLNELKANKNFHFQAHRSFDIFNQETPESFFDLNIEIITKNTTNKIAVIKNSIIVPAHKNPDKLELLMTSLAQQNLQDSEILIINDGCDNNITNLFQKYSFPFAKLINFKRKFIETEEHKFHRAGFSRNVGVIYSQSENLLFIDSDVVLPNGFLQGANSEIMKHDVVMFRKYKNKIPHFWRNLYSAQNWNQLENYWQYFNTACIAVKKALFLKAGGFSLCFSGYGGEDAFLGYRLQFFSNKWKLSNLTIEHPQSFLRRAQSVTLYKHSSQMIYRLTLNESFYQSHFVLMGEFLYLRKVIFYLNRFFITRIFLGLIGFCLAFLFTPYKAMTHYFYVVSENAWKVKMPLYWLQLNYWKSLRPIHFIKENIWRAPWLLIIPYHFIKNNFWRTKLLYHFAIANAWKIKIPFYSLVNLAGIVKANMWKIKYLYHVLVGSFWKIKIPFYSLVNLAGIVKANMWKIKYLYHVLVGSFWKIKIPIYWLNMNLWRLKSIYYFFSKHFWFFRSPAEWTKINIPFLYLILFKYPLKIFYFTRYQIFKRILKNLI